MAEKVLQALLKTSDSDPDESFIQAPSVGLFRGHLPERTGVVPDLHIGNMSVLGHVYQVLAPDGAVGVVTKCFFDDGVHAVDYGRPLFRLGKGNTLAPGVQKPGEARAEGDSARLKIRAPSDGVFYRRPDPQSPAYVEVGDVIEIGRPLGLVEVMKSFAQIRYQGRGLPPRARVVAIPVEDSDEIQNKQVLFFLEPA